MFEKSMHDLVRGIRNNRQNEARYIATCIDEIKRELKQENMNVKANAVAKLLYLQMLGYDISWAAFNVIEVMSSQKFTHKRIGYLCATQSFHEETDVLMLTTNMIKKDMSSQSQYEAAVALNGLSCFITSDLARDLANDLMSLLAAIRPYVKKHAILVMYKVFLNFPDALRPAFARLKDRLEDADAGVQSAAVNVICELARKNPRNYLSLAPVFFKLMSSSTNNWMLIKIIKLFGALAPLEPRLGKKLTEPLTNLIHSTSAMSLLYECVNTMIAAVPSHTASMQLCVTKLRVMIEDPDQNLKYLGLLSLGRILKYHPKVVQAHKDMILKCLEDKDESIRLRCLDLIYGMVSRKNLTEIIKKLMVHVDHAEGAAYRDELVCKITEICSQNNYQFVTNFEWYVTVLVELTKVEGTRHGRLLADQMLDVAIRVKTVRPFAVKQMAVLLDNLHLLSRNPGQQGACEVLYAAAWVCGEFSEYLDDPRSTLECMLRSRVTTLPPYVQSVFIHNVIKLYSHMLSQAEQKGDDDAGDFEDLREKIKEKLVVFVGSADLEVQERASCAIQLLKYLNKLQEKDVNGVAELAALFVGELNPVAPKAQRKVPVPEGLDLDKWINDPPSESEEESFSMEKAFFGNDVEPKRRHRTKEEEEEEEGEMQKRREARRQAQLSNPHYLQAAPKKSTTEIEEIPVTALTLDIPLRISNLGIEDKKSKKKRGKKHRKGKRHGNESSEEEIQPTKHRVEIRTEELPDGAVSTGDEDTVAKQGEDPHKALNIDLDRPLDADEVLPVRQHRVVTGEKEDVEQKDGEAEGKTKERRKKKKDKEKERKRNERKHRKKRTKGADPENDNAAAVVENEDTAEPVVDMVNAVNETVATSDSKPTPEVDDLDFWLSQSDAPVTASATTAEPTVDQKSKEDGVEVVVKNEEVVSKSRHKRGKKEKRDKKKNLKRSEVQEDPVVEEKQEEAEAVDEPEPVIVMTYLPLAADKHVDLTYELRVNPSINNQVVASVVFKNLSDGQLMNMDFNVLDSLNTKMVRPIGSPAHDGIRVPFQLPQGIANESQFAFTVDSILMPQKLRGTLTYMIKRTDGATSEKLDFKLSLPCCAFVIPVPCDGKQFSDLLSGGLLCEAQTVKLSPTKTSKFGQTLCHICSLLHLSVVERVEESASLYGSSIQKHHICLLVKSAEEGKVSVSAKSSDSSFIAHLLTELKSEL
ncbi:AP-3 complex subunit delta-1-like isoform X2 [Corticium candelabrum]|uniref:AP-3 complex subunit delta-1-like isoform X2 n=1 Tax=Corticium candelabrum TaxID=121492 RepID=UPI002E268D5E|nr:AP-3 complex subunit delta-1-like isoform X2 [Corticium candelabrum]